MSKQSSNTLLIHTEQPEIRIAQLRDGQLFDLFIERGGRLLNSIFKGRIANVISGMDAAFIDIGLQRNALIYAGDIAPPKSAKTALTISHLVKVGDELIVQVARPPVGNKGARVTTNLTLTGRYVVVSANDDKIGVSQRIENRDDRNRLRRIAEKLRPLDHGLILRTEAAGASESGLANDVEEIVNIIRKIRNQAAISSSPTLLYREPGVLGRVVRDRLNSSMESIWVDTTEEFEMVQSLVNQVAPDLLERVRFYDPCVAGNQPLFEKFGVAQDITSTQERSVSLPHGGTLVVDETEALCAIDVNTGKNVGKTRLAETVLQTNLEAVEAAARQIRLRNLSGVIVIDFIDMERQKDRIAVLDALELALSQDHNRTRIVQLSPSGLVEITRRRESPSLRQLLKRPCPYCQGNGAIKSQSTIAIEVRERVRRWAHENLRGEERNSIFQQGDPPPFSAANTLPHIMVTMHPEPACAFLGPANEYALNLENALSASIWLQVETNFHQETAAVHAFDVSQIPASTRQPLEAGTTISVPIQLARFPQKSPIFIAWNKRLVLISNMREWENQTGERCQIAIIDVGRWFASGKIVVENESVHENPQNDE